LLFVNGLGHLEVIRQLFHSLTLSRKKKKKGGWKNINKTRSFDKPNSFLKMVIILMSR
jgi:hypothetical protein